MKRVQKIAALLLCLMLPLTALPALAEDGEQGQKSQADVRQIVADEAQEPLLAAAQAQIGRENDVARPEKHGKQGETDNKNVQKVFAGVLHEGLLSGTTIWEFQKSEKSGNFSEDISV